MLRYIISSTHELYRYNVLVDEGGVDVSQGFINTALEGIMKIEVGKFYKTRDGQKVGPMEYDPKEDTSYQFSSKEFELDGGLISAWSESGEYVPGLVREEDLIAEWTDAPTGPVRTVTRKEIVSGQYGIVKVDADRPTGNPRIIVSAVPTAAEIRAAIATLTEIADALEEQ